jgi:PKD repeat protein
MSSLKKLFLVILCFMVIPGIAAAVAPVADFSNSTPATGVTPLNVSFTDASTGVPAGWAWFFGDENYNVPWTVVTNGADWSGRSHQSAVARPNGDIVLTGGRELSAWKNDTWLSSSTGLIWSEVSTSSGWTARSGHTSVAMPDGSIVLMGGSYNLTGGNVSDGMTNDTWRSTNSGITWTRMNASSGWTARTAHSSVVMPDGSIVLMGGAHSFTGGPDVDGRKSDVWRSTDNGGNWTQVSATSPWGSRQYFSTVAMPDGSIVLMGGYNGTYLNDTWRSVNNGLTWTPVNVNSGWGIRGSPSSVAMPDGSIVLMGGGDGDGVPEVPMRDDTWRSTDNGATWVQVNASGGWAPRNHHSTVGMPDGSILLMGGSYNDVFRYNPVGSSAQNPSHVYTVPGTYQVALQASNADGYSSTRKAGFVTVTAPASFPVANFTGTPTSGTAPLGVTFVDTSSGTSITNRLWDFGDGNTTSYVAATNPFHIYASAGQYTVNLTVTNASGSSSQLRTNYITVTSAGLSSSIGVFRPSTHSFYLDANGNGAWNGAVIDRAYNFGISTDLPISGDWNNDGITEIGVFRPSTQSFYLDFNGNGIWNGTTIDRAYKFGISTDLPVSGDWNNDGITKIGVFRPSTQSFYLDFNGNGTWDGALIDRAYKFGISTDLPVSGDWNNDGITKIGVFRPSTQSFYLDFNGNGTWDGALIDRAYKFGISTDLPVSGDWNNDGITEIGVFRPSTQSFYLDFNGNGIWNGTAIDRAYNFGLTGDKPVSGKWI